MKPTAPSRNKFSVFATTPCRGLSYLVDRMRRELLTAIFAITCLREATAQPAIVQTALRHQQPVYPIECRARRITGSGIVLATVNTIDGVSSHPALACSRAREQAPRRFCARGAFAVAV